MKCSACGNENVKDARFCSYCGAKLTPAEEPSGESAAENAASRTAQPLSDNPYQPRKMPTIYGGGSAPASSEASHAAPKQPRMFLFEDEKEEEAARLKELEAARKEAQRRQEAARRAEEDPFFDEDDEDEDDDYDDDEEETSRGRRKAFAVAISLVTVIILCVCALAFLFYTPTGSRMRAYYGMAADAEDYAALGDWQLQNGNQTEAAASYYTAFLLKQNDYDFALRIAQAFERCDAKERAEQMYMYLIDLYPLESDPYDYLMALLVREGKLDEYNALIEYRAEHQPGYVMPAAAHKPVDMPKASPAAGSFTGSVHITLTAGEGAVIYFTVDGSTPTENSRKYTGPIILYSGSYQLRAIAVQDGVASEILEAAYAVS